MAPVGTGLREGLAPLSPEVPAATAEMELAGARSAGEYRWTCEDDELLRRSEKLEPRGGERRLEVLAANDEEGLALLEVLGRRTKRA